MEREHNLRDMQGFASLLKVYIDRAGFSSLRAFARAAHTSIATVQGCVRGTRAPPIEQIPRWIKVLKLSPDNARDFTFAAYRTKGWKQVDARPYIEMAEEALRVANEELRTSEKNQQDLTRLYGEKKAALAWSEERIKQLEEAVRSLGGTVPPPPPPRLGDAPPGSSAPGT